MPRARRRGAGAAARVGAAFVFLFAAAFALGADLRAFVFRLALGFAAVFFAAFFRPVPDPFDFFTGLGQSFFTPPIGLPPAGVEVVVGGV
jgi:hypothetical protein